MLGAGRLITSRYLDGIGISFDPADESHHNECLITEVHKAYMHCHAGQMHRYHSPTVSRGGHMSEYNQVFHAM